MTDRNRKQQGFLVTNHLNLMFSLAYGLITPSSGFGNKYYEDTLSKYPGWIPLFIEKLPKSGIEMSIKEAKYLIPVIVEIDLTNLRYINKTSIRGNKRKRMPTPTPLFPSYLSESPSQDWELGSLYPGMSLLVHGTISTRRILTIYVRSDDDVKELQSQAVLRNNVPLQLYQVKRKKTLFTNSYKKWEWHHIDEKFLSNTHLNMTQAAGGILAMLYNVRFMGKKAMEAYEAAFDVKSLGTTIPGLNEWMRNSTIPSPSKSEEGYLLWGLVERIAKRRDRCSDNDLDVLVLDFLERTSEVNSTDHLCRTLRQLGGLGGKTISEYLDSHRSPLERALILFFIRRKCQELLEFRDRKWSDMDWVYSAILFGARSGWLRLPLELRGNKDIESIICNRMVSFCHHIAKTNR